MGTIPARLLDRYARYKLKYASDLVFVHINKTGGSSIERALGLPFQHKTALELRRELGERRWASRFTFTFVRNPWDKVASHYHFRVKTNQTGLAERPLPFTAWVRLAYGEQDPRYHDQPKMFMPQVCWISDESGLVIVDFVGRFERLSDDFDAICRRLGRTSTLPHLKRSTNDDYRREYSAEAAEIVAVRFAEDIRLFGYTFD